jgi:hypothetical protein
LAIRTKTMRFVGHGRNLRLRTLGAWGDDPLRDLADSCRADLAIEKLIYQSAKAARAAGHSWSEIGEALGITKQAAWERFARGLRGRGW